MGFSSRSGSEEGQSASDSKHRHGDSFSRIHVANFQTGSTINGKYYFNLSNRFNDDLKEKSTEFGQEDSYHPPIQYMITHEQIHYGDI